MTPIPPPGRRKTFEQAMWDVYVKHRKLFEMLSPHDGGRAFGHPTDPEPAMSATFKFKYSPHSKITYRLGPENKIHYWDGTSWQPSTILVRDWCDSNYFEQQEVPDPSARLPSNYHPDAYEYKRLAFADGRLIIYRRVPNGETDCWFAGCWIGQHPHLTDAEWAAASLTPCENPNAKPKYEYKYTSSGLSGSPITYRRRIDGSNTDYWEPTKRTWIAIPTYLDWNSSHFTPTTDPEMTRLPCINPAFDTDPWRKWMQFSAPKPTEYKYIPDSRVLDIDYAALELRILAHYATQSLNRDDLAQTAMESLVRGRYTDVTPKVVARLSYEIADAMIEASKVQPKQP